MAKYIQSKDGLEWQESVGDNGPPFMNGYPRRTVIINGTMWVLCSWDWEHMNISAYYYKIAFWVINGPKHIFNTNDKEEAIARYNQIMNYPLTESVLAVL